MLSAVLLKASPPSILLVGQNVADRAAGESRAEQAVREEAGAHLDDLTGRGRVGRVHGGLPRRPVGRAWVQTPHQLDRAGELAGRAEQFHTERVVLTVGRLLADPRRDQAGRRDRARRLSCS